MHKPFSNYAGRVSNQNQTDSNKIEQFDVAVIGGGINGAVSAAALSGAGLRVLVLEKGDFAGFTSQESSNLVWGGIKYLQSLEFFLVFKLCVARNRLLRAYPNQIREIGFLASLGPNAPFGRALGLVGTLVYWAIGLFGTKAPQVFSAKRAKQLEPNLISGRHAVQYFDAYLPDNDSRFVFGFIQQAKSRGALTLNYTELVEANFDTTWHLTARNRDGQLTYFKSTALVNAAGPFAEGISETLQSRTKSKLVFSKGVHFVLDRKITNSNRVLAFWDEQDRLFYVLPMGDRSMIGTTDSRVEHPNTQVTKEDTEFVLRQINAQLELVEPIKENQIISSRCGVRPLVVDGGSNAKADWHQLSRKHVIEQNIERRVVTVLGGKLTDCLNVGEEVVAAVSKFGLKGNKPRSWFGEGLQNRKAEFYSKVMSQSGKDGYALARGLWRRHGELAFSIIGEEFLEDVLNGLAITKQEIKHIIRNEQVVTRQDLLRRRLPIAMSRSEEEIQKNQELQNIFAEFGI